VLALLPVTLVWIAFSPRPRRETGSAPVRR
jgi:hypothetical protein